MALTFKASGGSGDFKTVPAGSHIAVCNMVVELGMQPGSGMYPDPKHKIYVRFEIPAERIEYERDGVKHEGPQTIGIFFTASMHEKANLRKQLEGWRGRKFTDEEAESFDVSAIAGKGCMLNVVETVKGDKVYANVASISALPKGIKSPEVENPITVFELSNPNGFDQLPDWLQKKVNERIIVEPKQSTTEYIDSLHQAIGDDDIPF